MNQKRYTGKIVAGDPETRSSDMVAENLEHLKSLFPNAFTDGKVDFDVLRQLLGDTVEEQEEKYGLNWHGKRQARRLALTPSAGTLRPYPDESVDWETTQNLMIEGDNLEVLKLLQKSYTNKVKLIYIDPPYNTGKDFVYSDDYRDSIRNYFELTGQVDAENRKVSSNTEASGRFHTDWLNMIYPRLMLARNLLKSEGVILISIDDTEAHNLREVCDEIFGGENFCGTFVWEKKKKPSFLDRNMGSVTDYIVAYAKNRDLAPPFVAGAVEDGKKYPFNNAGNPSSILRFPPGSVKFSCGDQLVRAQDMSEGNIKTELLDDVRIVEGINANEFRLKGEWRYSQSKVDEFVGANAEIVIKKIPFRPNYVNRSRELKKTANLLSHRVNGIPTNEDATTEMRDLFKMDIMSYPKPTGLLKYLIRAVSSGNDTVMDFFAGSGTMGAATLLQNLEDGFGRRYILVQLPEPLEPRNKEQQVAAGLCDKMQVPRSISELTKEYLRRMGKKLRKENSLFSGDFGFRVFKFDSTNFLEWKSKEEDLETMLQLSVENLKANRTETDLLFELLLKRGLDLCASIETRIIAGKMVHSIGGGVLIACLDKKITEMEVEELGLGIAEWSGVLASSGETTCIFCDNAFTNDVAKVNLTAILDQKGIASVRSV